MKDGVAPPQITLLAFGLLVAIGIGNSIVNSATSPADLGEGQEARFRKSQYVVGFVISTALVALLIFTPLSRSILAWLFAPIIVLPYALIIRAKILE